MKLYHYTTRSYATTILAEGFHDSPGDSLFPAGVWLSDSPDEGDRAMRRQREGRTLAIDMPDDLAHRYLIADFPGCWREFCIPAATVNRLPRSVAR